MVLFLDSYMSSVPIRTSPVQLFFKPPLANRVRSVLLLCENCSKNWHLLGFLCKVNILSLFFFFQWNWCYWFCLIFLYTSSLDWNSSVLQWFSHKKDLLSLMCSQSLYLPLLFTSLRIKWERNMKSFTCVQVSAVWSHSGLNLGIRNLGSFLKVSHVIILQVCSFYSCCIRLLSHSEGWYKKSLICTLVC